MLSQLRTLWYIFLHLFHRRETVQYPEEKPYLAPRFRGRCIFCGWCEEACPTYAIQLTPDFEMSEYERPNLVYEKEDLLISGTGKYPDYSFWRVSGKAIGD